MPASSLVRSSFARALLSALFLSAVAGCAASPPQATAPASGSGGAPATGQQQGSFNTGRLTVVVTNQNGRPLERAQVDVVATGNTHFRTTGVTNRDGTVSFNGVPQSINVSVNHPTGSYSQNFNVTPNGTSEMRLIVDTIEQEEDPAAAGAAGGNAGGGPF